MPRWEQTPLEDGGERHELLAKHVGVDVTTHPAERFTVISLALMVAGADEATVDRCKRRAERLLSDALRA